MKTKKLMGSFCAGLFLVGSVVRSQAVTFDFRSFENGGNVGDYFNGYAASVAGVDDLGLFGGSIYPISNFPFGEPVGQTWFNYTSGSSALGLGIKSKGLPGDQPTQVDVGEAIFFEFSQDVYVNSITLQVFFKTASDGVGGPVSEKNDVAQFDSMSLIDGTSTSIATVASPYDYTTGNPTTYTINFNDLLGGDGALVDFDHGFLFYPTAGDGFRLQSMDVTPIPFEEQPVPEAGTIAGAVALVAAAVAGRRRAGKK